MPFEIENLEALVDEQLRRERFKTFEASLQVDEQNEIAETFELAARNDIRTGLEQATLSFIQEYIRFEFNVRDKFPIMNDEQREMLEMARASILRILIILQTARSGAQSAEKSQAVQN